MPSPRTIRLTLLASCLFLLFVFTVGTIQLVLHVRNVIAQSQAVANLVAPPTPPAAPGGNGSPRPRPDLEFYVDGKNPSQVSSTQPIAWQTYDFARHHGGMNILFGDGHVEWLSFGAARQILPLQPTTAQVKGGR